GAAAARMRRASLVSSAPWATASAVVRTSSCPSTEANQRRTFWTISAWVSPSKLRLAMARNYLGYEFPRPVDVFRLGGGLADRHPHHQVVVHTGMGEQRLARLVDLVQDGLSDLVTRGGPEAHQVQPPWRGQDELVVGPHPGLDGLCQFDVA